MDNYEFEDDSELTKEYFNATKEESKPKKETRERITFLKNLTLNDGEEMLFRVVQIPGQKTYHRKKSHYVGSVKIPGINIPKNVNFVGCAESKECLGEEIQEYILAKKADAEFGSAEEKKLWTMSNSVSATPRIEMIGIDRRDGELKLWEVSCHGEKSPGAEVLKWSLSKKYGNPAHPTEGYDFKLKKISKKEWVVTPLDDASPLTPSEIEKIKECKHTFEFSKKKCTIEFQKKLGITFGETETVSTPRVPREESAPPKPEPIVHEEEEDDDIPF